MRVVLETDILSKASYSELGTVFYHAFTGQHRILVEDQDAPAFLAWLDGLEKEQRQEWQMALDDGLRLDGQDPAYYGIRIAHLEMSSWNLPVPRLTLADAIQLLKVPFCVLLEDDQADRAFLLSMIEPEQKEYLLKLEDRGHVHFAHGGGLGKMTATVKRARKARIAPFGRLWVLFDSDGLRPKLSSNSAKKLADVCDGKATEGHGGQIPYHMLARRSIENYIPLTSLKSWIDRLPPRRRGGLPAKHVALGKMSDEQRYHFNMKDGFSGDRNRQDAATVGDLYDNLPVEDRQALDKGFGKKIAERFQDQVTERQLRSDGGWDEVHPHVDKLIRYIR